MARDATGEKFVFQAIDESTKNHQDDDESYGGNMYEIGGKMCPVFTFELYTSLLNPENDCFFQRAKPGYFDKNEDACMFDNARKGSTALGDMMAVISKDAKLSKRYTNHCIRATCVSLLDENYDPTQIMGVSMHKSLSSVLSYRGRVKKSKKRDMSRSLSAACVPSSAKNCAESVAAPPSSVVNAEVACVNHNEASAQSQDIDMIDDELDKILQSVDMQQITQTTMMSAPVFNMYGATTVVVHNHYHGH